MLVDTSERLGDGCGYGERWRFARSGVARERAEEGGETRERVREVQGGAWRREGGPGRRGSTQAGWRWPACGCARRARAPAYWREEDCDRGAAVVGWAGHLGRQVSPGEVLLSHLSIVFCFLFSVIVLALLKMPEHFQKF